MPLSRPSKKWMKTCIIAVNPTRPLKKKTVKQSKAAICGFIWKKISPAVKKRIKKNKESFRK